MFDLVYGFRSQSTAMAMSWRSVNLLNQTFSWASMTKGLSSSFIRLTSTSCSYLYYYLAWFTERTVGQSNRQIACICEQSSFTQTINAPTHFTEHSSSLIDIILTNNENHLVYTEVGDPFLNQEVGDHCPVFGILNFTKPKRKSYLHYTWSYDQGDYNLLREKAATTNWEKIYDQGVNKHVKKITGHIIDISIACIPNRPIRIRPDEPSWMNTNIKHYIRLRKRVYRKAKRTNTTHHWTKFRVLRNKVVSMIRESKSKSNVNIANKLKSDTLSAKDWWSTLETVISP